MNPDNLSISKENRILETLRSWQRLWSAESTLKPTRICLWSPWPGWKRQ